MRMFVLERGEDATGISGTGVVAEGVEFSDGTVALRWVVGRHLSMVMWESLEDVVAVHGHEGMTKVVRVSEASPTAIPPGHNPDYDLIRKGENTES